MRSVVLLSTALHPVSQQLSCNQSELTAWQLAQSLSLDITALHVGSKAEIKPYLGYGINKIQIIESTQVIENLTAYFINNQADVIFTGLQAKGQMDTGLVPYILAEKLKLPLVHSVLRANKVDKKLQLSQDLGSGRRRELLISTPAIITTANSLQVNLAYSHLNSLQADINIIKSNDKINEIRPTDNLSTKQTTYKKITIASQQSGHQRLQSLIAAKDAGGKIVCDGDVSHKAKIFIKYLQENGVNI